MYSTLKSAGEGFYLHRFQTPTEGAGKRALLHFGGVWASAEVWLNGKALGRHDSGFTSFAFDASKAIRASGENLLAVRVRQITHDYEYDVNDDWSLGGIYRDVWLEWTPTDTWIDRVETTTRFDAQYCDADLEIRALVCRALTISTLCRPVNEFINDLETMNPAKLAGSDWRVRRVGKSVGPSRG